MGLIHITPPQKKPSITNPKEMNKRKSNVTMGDDVRVWKRLLQSKQVSLEDSIFNDISIDPVFEYEEEKLSNTEFSVRNIYKSYRK